MLEDIKPKKSAAVARINRKPVVTKKPSLDDEIGDAFVPPDQVAAAEEAVVAATVTATDKPTIAAAEAKELPSTDTKAPTTPKTPKGDKPKWQWWPPKQLVKKQWMIVGGVGLALIILALILVLVIFHHKPPVKQLTTHKTVAKVAPKPVTVASRLTGLPVSIAQSKMPVTGVMIENSVDARPQSGLDQAGVIYEAVAEGGVTRFMALFEDNQPPYVGPVRSARPYFLRWLLPFDAGYAHVGGSADALSDIRNLGIKDLDQFANGGYYQRINSRDAPHNVYTSLGNLLTLEKAKKYDTSSFTGFSRKEEAPSKVPAAISIDFTISGPAYSVHYDYDPGYNNYKRSEAGVPHMVVDQAGNQTQLAPKVVIALVIPQSSGALDASGAYYTNYDTIGTGAMYVFQDGAVTTGSWSKADDRSQFTFADGNGKPLALNAGQTWISVVGLSGDVSYK